ncbi:MAG: hypothetical protein HY264_04510 [Chloroflexi bacterium]|nr:hypothetical protein [Chloroflexota bacterium]
MRDTSTDANGGRSELARGAWPLLLITILLSALTLWAADRRRRRQMER